MNRELWFLEAVKRLESQVFKPVGYGLPRFRVGCGWPTANKKKAGAECFDCKRSSDETYEIFISPRMADSLHILEILVHELCHTIAGIAAGHKKPFIEVMRAVGMDRPWKGSHAGVDLTVKLMAIQNKLEAYPHAELALKESGGKKQSTRLIKLCCPECGLKVRITKKWLYEIARTDKAPSCWLCGGVMS